VFLLSTFVMNMSQVQSPESSSSTLLLIPARMGSTRLPDKPLADIHGEPMIVHVWRRACEAKLGPVCVAADDARIVRVIEQQGGQAILTASHHQSGSDRIFEALNLIDPTQKYQNIVNIQGDLPVLESATVHACAGLLSDSAVDIATVAAEIEREDEKTNPNVVKVVGTPLSAKRLRALYFTRATAPYGQGPLYHHIGLYAYRRHALARFVAQPPSTLELREKLEQLRALEAGMRIDVGLVSTVPLGVDTPDDLKRARALLAK
jgi:3-deoxy-manno-octulosonate cytidylyltransferase (CMP-KDO synthetase)